YSPCGSSPVARAYFSSFSGIANLSASSVQHTCIPRHQVSADLTARECPLGVSGSNVSHAQLDVLGNMTCMLDSSYILNSDVYVLEKLKLCQDLSSDQSSAVETILLTRNTTYGTPGTWTLSTLENLGVLPLSTYSFPTHLLPGLLSTLRAGYRDQTCSSRTPQVNSAEVPLRCENPDGRDMGVSIPTLISLVLPVQLQTVHSVYIWFHSLPACTMGNITQVQVNDNSFPFGYDATQFSACLSVQTLKENLAAITDKIMGSDFQRVVLDKLNQAYPSVISDEVVQVLGPASRAATIEDINKWNITKIDTLSSLMRSYDGSWSSDLQVKAIVSKYLSVSGNSLGSSELNSIGGTNLCLLDISVISTIKSTSLQSARALSVSNCSQEQKQALFNIAQSAFSDKALTKNARATGTVSTNSYQLMISYLGGADRSYVQTLSASNISMDLSTFISLNPSVVNNLTVSEVKGLLGSNLASLKTYENNTVVRNWISLQLQSDLDGLGIGLTGGRAAATAAPSSSSAATAATAASTAATTKPSGQCGREPGTLIRSMKEGSRFGRS
ncbi:hypothetical protein NFI96_021853, partial [Prochilodus magdalenae]